MSENSPKLPKLMPRENPLPKDFPDVIVQASSLDESRNKNSEEHRQLYDEAKKQGDPESAAKLAHAMVVPEKIEKMKEQFGDQDPVLLPVIGREDKSLNMIPLAVAKEIAAQTGWDVETDVLQIAKKGRTGLSGTERFTAQASFEGDIDPERKYILVDDHAAMGGTLRNLADHVMQQGGEVVGMTTMTAGRNGQKVAPSPKAINRLNQEYGTEIVELHNEMFGVKEKPDATEREKRDAKKLRPENTLLTHGEACYLSEYEGGLQQFRKDVEKDVMALRFNEASQQEQQGVQGEKTDLDFPVEKVKKQEKEQRKAKPVDDLSHIDDDLAALNLDGIKDLGRDEAESRSPSKSDDVSPKDKGGKGGSGM